MIHFNRRPSNNNFPGRPNMNPGRPGLKMMPQRPQGGGGGEVMSCWDALECSGLDTSHPNARSEWMMYILVAAKTGLIRRVGQGQYIIGPEFWADAQQRFGGEGGGSGNGGGGGYEDPYGDDEGYGQDPSVGFGGRFGGGIGGGEGRPPHPNFF